MVPHGHPSACTSFPRDTVLHGGRQRWSQRLPSDAIWRRRPCCCGSSSQHRAPRAVVLATLPTPIAAGARTKEIRESEATLRKTSTPSVSSPVSGFAPFSPPTPANQDSSGISDASKGRQYVVPHDDDLLAWQGSRVPLELAADQVPASNRRRPNSTFASSAPRISEAPTMFLSRLLRCGHDDPRSCRSAPDRCSCRLHRGFDVSADFGKRDFEAKCFAWAGGHGKGD